MTVDKDSFVWELKNVDEREILSFVQCFNLTEIVARLLFLRGVQFDEVAWFLNPLLKNSLMDPFHLLDMKKAVDRAAKAMELGQKLAIYGDYDVDGACSSAMLKLYFNNFDIDAEIYIPDRIKEGYGPNKKAFQHLRKNKQIDLCFTVDCGTVANEVIDYAKEINLDVIVIDHHKSSHVIPNAEAVINPNRFDQEDSSCVNLAAVGVTFMFLVALNKVLRERDFFDNSKFLEPRLMDYLDLVALGTVCDVMKLNGLNRSFVFQGLKVISKRKNIGLSTLIDMLGVDEPISTYHLGYLIGPNINAGGRIGKSYLGAELLSSSCASKAANLASELYWYNQKRKEFELQVLNECMGKIDDHNANFIMIVGKGWHPGVIGIVASRGQRKVNIPVAIVSMDENGLGKASARSVPGVDFGAAVLYAKAIGLVEEGGGHNMAAGFSVKQENLKRLEQFFHDSFGVLKKNTFLKADADINVDSINLDLIEQVNKLAPFGQGNPEPIFFVCDVKIVSSKIVSEQHISCIVSSKYGKCSIRAIAFRGMEKKFAQSLLKKRSISMIVGKLKLNYWNGSKTVNLIIEDVI